MKVSLPVFVMMKKLEFLYIHLIYLAFSSFFKTSLAASKLIEVLAASLNVSSACFSVYFLTIFGIAFVKAISAQQVFLSESTNNCRSPYAALDLDFFFLLPPVVVFYSIIAIDLN